MRILILMQIQFLKLTFSIEIYHNISIVVDNCSVYYHIELLCMLWKE